MDSVIKQLKAMGGEGRIGKGYYHLCGNGYHQGPRCKQAKESK